MDGWAFVRARRDKQADSVPVEWTRQDREEGEPLGLVPLRGGRGRDEGDGSGAAESRVDGGSGSTPTHPRRMAHAISHRGHEPA